MKKTIHFLKIFFVISVISISQASAQTYIKITDGIEFDNIISEHFSKDGPAAFDGDVNTYVDALFGSDGYVGLDLTSLNKITKIRFYPRTDQTARMSGGKFQGSFDGVHFNDIYTVSTTPIENEWTEVLIDADCQFVRYLSPTNGYCNVSEIEFYRTEGLDPVAVPVESVSLENTSYTVKAGETVIVNNTILPQTATNQRYTYSFDPEGLASINASTGLLTALSVGTGTITITTNDGAKTATSSLIITAPSDVKLTGTVFANSGNETSGYAFDGNTSTFFDGSSIAYMGLDLGSANKISKIKFYPRSSWSTRMVGGKFQGSNDDVDYTDIYTISAQPQENMWTTVEVDANSNNYRYVRYLGPASGYGNVSEIEFRTPYVNPSTGLNQPDMKKVVLYPSPMTDRLSLSVNADKVIITGIDGKEVLISRGSNVDVSSLTKGIYLVKYFVGENIGTSKIIKK